MKAKKLLSRLCVVILSVFSLLPAAVYAEKDEPGWVLIESRISQPADIVQDDWVRFTEVMEKERFFQACEEVHTVDSYGNLPDGVTIGAAEHTEIQVTEGYTHTVSWTSPPTFISLKDCRDILLSFTVDYSGYASPSEFGNSSTDEFPSLVSLRCKIGPWKEAKDSFFTWVDADPVESHIENHATHTMTLRPTHYTYNGNLPDKVAFWKQPNEMFDHTYEKTVLALEVLIERKLSPYEDTYEETVLAPVVTYYYELNDDSLSALPVLQEFNSNADNRTDEIGTIVDSHIINGNTAAKIAAGAGAVLIGGAMVGSSQTLTKDEKNKQYRMYFRKDFGDTIFYDASPQLVYARMVELDEQGHEISRDDLTGQIQFFSKDGSLTVQTAGMSGSYASAWISVSSVNNASHETGILSVSFTGKGGSFCNHIAFQLQKSQIFFAQEELILPAKYDNPTRLPFGVSSATATSIVSAVIEPAGIYDVTVEPGEKEGVYYAVISERKELSLSEKGAGEHEDYTLHIIAETATDKSKRLMGSLPICRFYMGLCVKLKHNYIGCYLEPKEHRKGIDPSMLKASDLQPSVTQLHMALFTWNEEDHSLLCVPVVPSAFQILPETANDTAAKEHIKKMQILCSMDKIVQLKGYSFAEGAIACTAAVLDTPLRHRAILRFRAEYGGKAFTYEYRLALLSQPYRELGPENLARYQREDRKYRENLERIQKIIDRQGYYQNLFPLYKLIDTMLDAYKVEFGFDSYQYRLCLDVFDRFMRGDLSGANARPQVITPADEMYMFITATLDKATEVEDSMGFMSRMALGVATLGASDAAFTGMRVLKEMKDYAENGGSSVLEGFFIGAKTVTADYITDKLMGKAVAFGSKGLKKVAEIPSVQKALEDVTDISVDTVKTVTGYDISTAAKRVMQRMQTSKNAKASAKAKGRAALEADRFAPTPKDTDLQKAYRDGLDIGQQKVMDLHASYELMQMNPTRENIDLFNQVTKQVQADPYAMYEMMKRTDIPEVFAAFNKQLEVTYQATDRQIREMLAKKYRVSTEDVEVFCASSKDKADLLSGKKVTKDRDVTLKVKGEYIPQEEAERIYQQSFRDQLNGGRIDRDYGNADSYVQTDLKELDAKLDRQAAKRYDHAVVQKTSGENYGSEDDLRRMIDPEFYSQALDDSLRVRNTVKFKGQEWLEQGYTAAKNGDFTTALAMRKEGMRQTLKQFRIADGRNAARFVENGKSVISDTLRTQMAVVESCIEDTAISPSSVDSTLATMGTTFEALLEQVADLFPAIG